MYTCVWLLYSNPLLPTLVPPGNLPCPLLMEACPSGLPDAHHLFRLPSAQQLHHSAAVSASFLVSLALQLGCGYPMSFSCPSSSPLLPLSPSSGMGRQVTHGRNFFNGAHLSWGWGETSEAGILLSWAHLLPAPSPHCLSLRLQPRL